MFALIAAILFVVAAFVHGFNGGDDALFWVFLALAAWALHFAFDVALPIVRRR